MKKVLSGALALSVFMTSVVPAFAEGNSAVMVAEPTTVTYAEPAYNYSEALQKSILFYEYQMTGDLPDNYRVNWRKDTHLDDGSDVGLDLSGGWYDAGDHVKFNLPMSYTAMILGWTAIESGDYLKANGEYDNLVAQVKWANDYFIKCHPDSETYYFQVGEGNADHSMWVAPEVLFMDRPSYKVTVDKPGSCVTAETAASLAVASIIFKDSDPAYSQKCLEYSKSLISLAERMNGDDYYNEIAGQFYKSWSGYYDELVLANAWLYKATGDQTYLDKAEAYADKWGKLTAWDEYGNTVELETVKYNWTISWDDVTYASALLLAEITDKAEYHEVVVRNLDYWTTGNDLGDRIKYTSKGLAYCDGWGALRYAANASFMALLYAENPNCSAERAQTYRDFAKSQIDYALGSTGRSYLCGFGVNPPKNPHHRAASGVWSNNVNAAEPATNRHVLVGALVGGPNEYDEYVDLRPEYTFTEVACDYNACFTGVLAKLSEMHGGTFLDNVTGYEESDGAEIVASSGINYQPVPNGFEIITVIYNHTAWPARIVDEFQYVAFVDISDVLAKGYSPSDMVMSGYGGGSCSISEIKPYDEANGIYYYEFNVTNATGFYPGGEGPCKYELKFRLTAPCEWDYSKSPCYQNLDGTTSTNLVPAQGTIIYEDGVEMYNTFSAEPINRAPAVKDDEAATKCNESVTIDVLANDTDADGSINASTLTVVSQPARGTAAVSNGSIVYTPTGSEDDCGTYTFTYSVADNEGEVSKAATVTVIVTDKDGNIKNSAPVAVDDSADAFRNNKVTIDVLANDSDSDGTLDSSTLTVVTAPANGTAAVSGGKIIYTPAAAFLGTDSFTYTVADNYGKVSNTATVTVTVKEVPMAEGNIGFDFKINSTWDRSFTATITLTNNTDSTLTNWSVSVGWPTTVISEAYTGILSADGDTYNIGWKYNDSIAPGQSVTIDLQGTGDSTVDSMESIVFYADNYLYTIKSSGNVDPEPEENKAPSASADSTSTEQDNAVTIDVLANDTDSDGTIDASTLAVATQPANGTAAVSDGRIVYTPNSGFYGTDSFTYTVADNDGATATANVTVTVDKAEVEEHNPVNPAMFLGGSLRIDASTAEKASLRLGYAIDRNLPEGAEIVEWSWKYGYDENNLAYTKKGEKYTDMSVGRVSNLVITDIPADYYKFTYYVQISVVYELDGVKYSTTDSTVYARNIYDVATAVVNDPTESESARAYAQSLIDWYDNQGWTGYF